MPTAASCPVAVSRKTIARPLRVGVSLSVHKKQPRRFSHGCGTRRGKSSGGNHLRRLFGFLPRSRHAPGLWPQFLPPLPRLLLRRCRWGRFLPPVPFTFPPRWLPSQPATGQCGGSRPGAGNAGGGGALPAALPALHPFLSPEWDPPLCRLRREPCPPCRAPRRGRLRVQGERNASSNTLSLPERC